MSRPPRVLISYSHDSSSHRQRVIELAQRLRRDGIDAWLDVFDPAPPQGWPAWMAEQVRQADFIVLVCTASYRARFERTEQPGLSRGVKYEGLLARQLLYEGALDHSRVVPVLLDGSTMEDIPVEARPGTCYRLPDAYEPLRRQLTRQRSVEPAPLGTPEHGSAGLPDELDATDRLAVLHDDLERRVSEGKDTREVDAAILELRREIRSGPSLTEGDVLAGRYRLVEEAGHGGFATVWRAFDRSAKRPVAVKVLHGQWANDRTRVERFMSGARQMGRLHHQAIVPILGEPLRDDHHHFFVMPWLAGGDLHRAITQRGLTRSLGLAAVARAVEGLAHAHENGLVHRDVKPANILLDEQSRGLLCDFDLVRAAVSSHGTRSGDGMGSIVYAPVELLHDARNADARADVYGAAMCVLFVLARIEPPLFVSLTQPAYLNTLDCSKRLESALRGALAYERDHRTTTIEELVAAIDDELRGRTGASGFQASLGPDAPRWADASGRDGYGRWASFHVGNVEQRMRRIEPGAFMMGSPPNESGRDPGEGPQHLVTLNDGFWLADTPCTQALWQAVMGENPSRFESPRRPVERVAWHDVGNFLERLAAQVPGLEPRLPTEAQWEYACRAGTRTATHTGSLQLVGRRDAPVLDAIAWYGGNSGVGWDLDAACGHDSSAWIEKQHGHVRAGTRVTGQKRPNPWGLYDMLGNVWEWCADGIRSYAASPMSDPVGPHGRPRVVRGGSWLSEAREVRAAFRGWHGPSEQVESLGFRILLLEPE